jgi:putative transposase
VDAEDRTDHRQARAMTTRAAAPAPTPRKPGPKTRHSDGEVVEAIRAILAATPFHCEGYRKIRARLAQC